jgi:NodT family efflux transporter outer membrane factor (OMF) lipoprotein
MNTTLRPFLWAAALALGATVVAPAQNQPAAVGPRVTPPVPEAAAADRVPATFWEAFGDSTLRRMIDEALERNHDVEVADARLRGARAARSSSALDLAPAITATGGYTRQRVASPLVPGAVGALPDEDLWDAGLRLSWEVDVFGRGRRSLEARGELVAASDEDLRDVKVLITAAIAGAYFELRGAQDRLAVAGRNAENQRGTLEIALQRLEGGRGTALDSERARAQLSTTLAEIPALESAIIAARYRLGVLSGRHPERLAIEVGSASAPVVLPELAVAADSFVLRRADVRAAERHVAASAAFVGAARAEYLPRLTLSGGAGYTSSAFESLGNGGTPRYTIGPIISWPALDFARVKAGVDAARANEAEAKARYAQTVLQARGETETALAAYGRARARLEHLAAAAAASERAAELARLRYTEGASDFLQVLDAERTLLDAQDRRALGRTNAAMALVAVYRALGGAWPLGPQVSR